MAYLTYSVSGVLLHSQQGHHRDGPAGVVNMLDEEGSVSTPDCFLSRASWDELFLNTVPENAEPTSPSGADEEDFDDGDSDDNEEDLAGDGRLPEGKAADSKSLPPKKGKRLKSRGTQHAMEGTCLDFMDNEEELEEVLHFCCADIISQNVWSA